MSKSSNLFLKVREEEQGLLHLKKADLYGKANDLTMCVVDGFVDPMQAYIEVRKRIELLTYMEGMIRPHAESAAQIPKGGEERYGVKLEEVELGGKFDYVVCEDPVYNRLIEKLENLKLEVKNRETFLKMCKNGDPLVDPDTGESYELKSAPIKSGGRMGLKITIK